MYIYLSGVHKFRNQGGPITFSTVAANICVPLILNLLHITLLAPRILVLLLDFCKFFKTVQ